MKKQGLGTVFLVISILFAVAGSIIYWVNTHGGYYKDFKLEIIVYAVLGIIVLVILKILTTIKGEKQGVDILYILAAVLLAWAGIKFLGNRVESAAIILGSELEAGNRLAKQSLFQAFAGAGCFFLGMLMTGVTGFFEQQRAKIEDK